MSESSSDPSASPRRPVAHWKPGLAIAAVLVTGMLVYQHRQHPATAVTPAAPPVPGGQGAPLEPIAAPATALRDELQIRSDLRKALGREGSATPQQRLDMLLNIHGTLSPVESAALFHEIATPRAPAVNEGWHSVYFQNLCLILREQPAVRAAYARTLAAVARDHGQDAVIRDYAVQHLRQVWDKAADSIPLDSGTPGHEAKQSETDALALRSSIERTFHDLAASDEPALAATGLLSLHLLGTFQGEGSLPIPGEKRRALPAGLAAGAGKVAASHRIPDDQLQPLVQSLLTAPPTAANLACRLTAVRVVSDRRMASALPLLRRIAADTSGEHTLARMAAIAALGRFKYPADRPFLESLDHRDGRIAAAVKTALSADN